MKLSGYLIKGAVLCGLWFCMQGQSAVAQSQVDTSQQIVPGRVNLKAQQQKPYLVMISIDGFRWDLADKYNARFLQKMRAQGVKAQSMQPSYPSLTFPNHYAIITGMYPSHHGIVDNYFYDPVKKASYKVGDKNAVLDSSWYGAEPLWVLAEKAGMLTASFYWVGTEAAIDGVRPTYYYNYNETIPIDHRVSVVKNWLELPQDKRPHLITFYFPEVDHMEHMHGVDSPETQAAVQYVDQSIEKLYDSCMATGLPVNFIVLSDHGFANLDTTKYLSVPKLDTSHYLIRGGSALTHIYAKDEQGKKSLNNLYKELKTNAQNYKVFKASKTPKRWHYRSKDNKDGRIGDILLVPYPPYSFYFGGRKGLGAHGFDNQLPEMQATFYAWGPKFNQHQEIKNFPNIAVYPMAARLLGLKIPVNLKIDGKLKTLAPILKKDQ
ncbi:Predicted pyrophosphatase or phosphodiesterase, AlkP superfamily [Arachidicoccus rhizosphaerae]|uniref:Predicted pyrophosphatase or phosphodiesterase, AlkP superfamily n=2 Tax=Arachidicoccus rhizosphaerae TaxID=551991 RepID=A0A1H4BAV6_9BACT|nr:Predicted pyrophosphatase or phosphodiesterase, AlkP superfamily [Arachidicoccus rhizosphaerae]